MKDPFIMLDGLVKKLENPKNVFRSRKSSNMPNNVI